MITLINSSLTSHSFKHKSTDIQINLLQSHPHSSISSTAFTTSNVFFFFTTTAERQLRQILQATVRTTPRFLSHEILGILFLRTLTMGRVTGRIKCDVLPLRNLSDITRRTLPMGRNPTKIKCLFLLTIRKGCGVLECE